MSSRNRVSIALLGAAIAGVAALPFLYWNAFAGDAQVHLVFMESAAAGRFFEFNPGERVSGETSPGYMLLGGLFFRIFPAAQVPVALKVVGLLAWYAFGVLVYHAARRLLDDGPRPRAWSALAALLSMALPGSVYNANAGMENGLFAALIWAWVALALRWGWASTGPRTLWKEIALGGLLGFASWFRPEALPFALVTYTALVVTDHRLAGSLMCGLAVTLAMCSLVVAFQYAYTGDLVPTSVLSRRVVAMPAALHVGPLMFDPTFALRLALYAPITLPFLWGLHERSGTILPLERLLWLVLGAFFTLLTLFGAPHLARYIIFLMPILVIGALRALRRMWHGSSRARFLVGFAAAAWLVMNVEELRRRRERFAGAQLSVAMRASEERPAKTDRLLTAFGSPVRKPVTVALEAVQLRYELDERIMVRSLDGRVDRELLHYVDRYSVDHISYLRDRGIDFLLDTPTYSRSPSEGSLTPLRALPHDRALTIAGVRFRRLRAPARAYAVEHLGK